MKKITLRGEVQFETEISTGSSDLPVGWPQKLDGFE